MLGEGLDDVFQVLADQRLAALDQHQEAAELTQLLGNASVVRDRQLFLLGRHVGPEVTEAALHVAAIGDLNEHLKRPPPQQAERKARVLAHHRQLHRNDQPPRYCSESRTVTSFNSGVSLVYCPSSRAISVTARESSASLIVSGGSSRSTFQCCDAGWHTMPRSSSRTESHCPNTFSDTLSTTPEKAR